MPCSAAEGAQVDPATATALVDASGGTGRLPGASALPHIRSGALDAEQAQPVGEHLPGGVVEPQPGAVGVGDRLVAERDDAALLVVPLVVVPASSSR